MNCIAKRRKRSKKKQSLPKAPQPTISCSSYMPIKAFHTPAGEVWVGALSFE